MPKPKKPSIEHQAKQYWLVHYGPKAIKDRNVRKVYTSEDAEWHFRFYQDNGFHVDVTHYLIETTTTVTKLTY